MTTFSIVTPSLNQGRFLPEALESVRLQKHGSVEHLVVDGGSTDNTLHILQHLRAERAWSHLHWQSRSDSGQSNALNRGFLQTTGEFVGWLNTDDRYRPGCFAHVERAFRNHPDVDIFYGDYAVIDERGQVVRFRREIEFSRFILTWHRVLYIPSTATFFRRRIFNDGYLVREELHFAMDYEYFLRLSAAGYVIRRIPHLLADFRVHPESKSSRLRELQHEERRQILYSFSPLAAGWSGTRRGRAMLAGLETAAAVLRYSEKLLRGAYFTRLPKPPSSLTQSAAEGSCES